MNLTLESGPTPVGALREEVQALAGEWEPPWYTTLNREPSKPSWFLARCEGELVGFLCLFDPTGEAVEVSAFVAPQHRRQRVFTRLLAEARQLWSDAGQTWLLVADRNDDAGSATAAHLATLEFTESTLSLEASRRPPFAGLPEGLTLMMAEATDAGQAALVMSGGENPGASGVRDFVLGIIADPERTLFLLKEGDRTVATLGLTRQGGHRWLFGLAVDPQRQRRGWARALVLAVMELSSRGALEYQLEVDSTNHQAEALYRSLGFADCRVTDYYRV